MDIKKLESVFELYGLGKITEAPKRIFGGLLHEIWRIETTIGIYAVKVLNSEIMQRSEAYDNFVFSEKIANIAKNNGISAVPAINLGEEILVKVQDKYCLVFPWVEGYTLSEKPAGEEFCYKIGRILAKIHNMGIENTTNSISYEKMLVSLNDLDELEENFKGISKKILVLQKNYNNSLSILNKESVISHTDIDQKNVLWDEQDNPMIIDWEAAGPINPMVELLTMALYWGGIVSEKVAESSFKAIIEGYSEIRQICYADIGKYLNGCAGFIFWLVYNIKRSKDTKHSNIEEIELANREIKKTVAVVDSFYSQIHEYKKWILEIQK